MQQRGGGITNCYTCNGACEVFIIRDSCLGRFHFDRRMRPLLIYTPHRHYEKIYEVPGGELQEMMLEIHAFMMDFMNTDSYQIQNNHGTFSSHKHLHIKIACDESWVEAKRDEHFRRRGLAPRLPVTSTQGFTWTGQGSQQFRGSPAGPGAVGFSGGFTTGPVNLENPYPTRAVCVRRPPGRKVNLRSDNLPWRPTVSPGPTSWESEKDACDSPVSEGNSAVPSAAELVMEGEETNASCTQQSCEGGPPSGP